MNKYEVNFANYYDKNPFIEFLDSLNKKERAEVLAFIEEFRDLKTKNMSLPKSLSKYLRDGIFELRVKHSNIISRSLYFYLDGKRIVFTNGFIKKTENTPLNEIEKALKYKKYYLSENKDEK